MVQTKKFSQFNGPDPIQNGDIVVGLRNGDNWQFTGVGGGGGGGTSIVIIIDQPNHNLSPGNWVRVNSLGEYVLALADTAENAEIAGTVLSVQNANQFTLQVIGYVDTGTFAGLITGSVYFLSDTLAGQMTLNEPVTNGFVSIPVFIATSPTQGWIRQWRGFIIGGQPFDQGGGGGDNPNIVVIDQTGHGLSVGQVVRLDGSITYVPAQADSLANAQAVGVVIEVIDANTFVLQTEGYNIGAIFQDAAGNPLVAGGVYYISPTIAGAVTLTNPVAVGDASKPMFICEQTAATTGANAGYIMPQRPIENTPAGDNPNIVIVDDPAHGFNIGDWVYVDGSLSYALGIATSLATSQVVGVVIDVPNVNQFVLQTNGYNVGAVTQDDAAAPVVPATIYYLSATVAGQLTAVAPSTVGLFTKPLFVCEQTFGITGINAGYISEQRPLPVNDGTDPSIVTINQVAHNLIVGDVVRLDGPTDYVPAQGDSLANSQSVGVVIDVIDPDNFVLQTEGYTTNTIVADDLGAPVVPGTVYYLSTTLAGTVTAIAPTAVGQSVKPIFICEDTAVNFTGYILPQRPILNTPANSNPDITTVTQTGHGFSIGDWVYINSTVGISYALGIATSLDTSQVVGVVIDVPDANTFVLQSNGYNIGAVTVDDLGNPIDPNKVYYLSVLVAGAITVTAPSALGQFTKPLYVSEQTTAITGTDAGFVLEQRPLPASMGTNPSIVTITQIAHGLLLGMVVRLNASIVYVPALANNLANSQAVGVVIQVIDANTFVLQTEGYSSGAITLDASGAALVPASVYYLSPTVPGRVTATIPAAVGQSTKPIFICERAGGTPAGYIVPQRPLLNTAADENPDIVTVIQVAHGFVVGDWLYVSGSVTYAKGIATALATSQVVGVVIQVVDVNTFVLQTSGYNVGAITVDGTGAPVVASTIYYLSTTVAGRLQATAPVTIGQVTKPLYSCEQASGVTGTNAGYILEQRPLVNVPSGGGGEYQLIQQINLVNTNLIDLTGLFSGYRDIKIVGSNIIFRTLSNNDPSASGFFCRYEVDNVIRSDSNYYYSWDITAISSGGLLSTQRGVSNITFFSGETSASSPTLLRTPNNQSFNFIVEILGVDNATTTKQAFFDYNTNGYRTLYYPTYVTLAASYIGNFLDVTGAVFTFGSPGLYVIASGSLSVYGVPL